MELDLNELKRMAEEVQCWSNVSDAWANPDDEDQGVQMPTWIVGTIDDDDVHYDVAVVDCEQYSVPGESEKLAKFYAAANPAVVLELVRQLREAEARVAELEAERTEREKQEPVGYIIFPKHRKAPDVRWADNTKIMEGAAIYAAPPVTAQSEGQIDKPTSLLRRAADYLGDAGAPRLASEISSYLESQAQPTRGEG